MKRIVWLFGDGSTQFSLVDPNLRRKAETDEELVARLFDASKRKEGETDEELFERLVDPALRRPAETEEEHIARLVEKVGPTLRVSPVTLDLKFRTASEQEAYEASLGDGARAQFAGVITEDEYQAKRANARQYREAWTWTTPGPVIDIDMPKARELHRQHLRRVRAPLLAALDVEYQRADEINDDALKAEVVAAKQALRDVTADPAIDGAKAPEDLAKVWPECLTATVVTGQR